VLPAGADAVVDPGTWDEPRIFGEIRRLGDVTEMEMARVFNLGIGMVLAVDAAGAQSAVDALGAAGCRAHVVGHVTKGTGHVHIEAHS
jgi:phosphoribosylaminoimidazole (AIR) synthetase